MREIVEHKNNAKFAQGDLFSSDSEVYIFAETTTSTTYHVHIDDYFTDPSYYRKLQGLLSTASDLDTIVFHLNSGGGAIHVALPICHWVASTDAHTVAVIEYEAASAATFLMLACDSVICMPHTTIMCHGASWGISGSANLVRKTVKFQDEQINKLIRETYEGFLSKEEIDSIVENGEEFHLTAEEVIDRLKARQNNSQTLLLAEDGFEEALEEVIEEEKVRRKPAAKKAPAKRATRKTTTKK